MKKNDKRSKLLFFAGNTLIILTIAAIYFEFYDPYNVPIILRVILTMYWLYSLFGVIVSRIGSDELVSKIYFNVTRSYTK